MTDEQILDMWQELNNAFSRRGAPRDTPVIVQFARALLADGGKGEAVAWLHTMYMEGDQTDDRLSFSGENPWGEPGANYSEEYAVVSKPLYTAPQAECAPREAQPVACPHCWEVDCLTCGTDAAPTPERADAEKDAMDLAAGASEGQADTYDVRVAFEEIARAISEHEPPDRRVAVSMRALNRWHQALAKFLYATPPGAAAEIAALRERIAGSTAQDAQSGEDQK